MDGEHDGGVKERFKWGPHFHYFGDYTLGIVMLRTRGVFFHRLSERPETKTN